MTSCGSEVDLLKTFSTTFTAFNDALAPIISYLLNTNNVGKELQYLREWGDSLHKEFKHDVHCYHIANIVHNDGTDATREDMATGDVVVNVQPFDWEMIYELTNSITRIQV